MTTENIWNLYEDGAFRRKIGVELLTWAQYWTTAGLGEIEDALLRDQTKRAIRMILEDPSYAIKIVTGLAVCDPLILDNQSDTITDDIINRVVVGIMASKIQWVTGIDTVYSNSGVAEE